jgi:hypothetical protein
MHIEALISNNLAISVNTLESGKQPMETLIVPELFPRLFPRWHHRKPTRHE